ncbi:MAG: TRAP transporter substrate-binding protein [Deltaproteobacteria bacterium]|nr:TRAP transporter substrate-binding protein [Deltaproteobacteria bacterium]
MKKIAIIVAMFFLAVGFSMGAVSTDEAVAADGTYVFKYAHTQSANHPRSKSMDFFKEELEKASGGRIQVELYFGGVLGKEADVLDMVKMGAVQGCRGGLFERANKQFLIYTLPFMFENVDQVLKAMASPVGDKINKGALANGYYIPATGVAGGFRNITNSKRPITTLKSIKGLKMRTPPIDMTIKTFSALGANPQQIPYTETYMALKTGVVDGQENPFSNTVDMKFYEAQKYLSIVNWQVHPDPLYVNPAWYNALPEDLKKAFNSVAQATIQESNKIWLGSEDGYLKVLEKELKVNSLSDKARAEFLEAVKPVWQGYVDDEFFTWDEIKQVQNAAVK